MAIPTRPFDIAQAGCKSRSGYEYVLWRRYTSSASLMVIGDVVVENFWALSARGTQWEGPHRPCFHFSTVTLLSKRTIHASNECHGLNVKPPQDQTAPKEKVQWTLCEYGDSPVTVASFVLDVNSSGQRLGCDEEQSAEIQ